MTNIEGGLSDYLFSPDEKQLAYIKEISFGKSTKEIYPDLPKATGRIVTDLMYKHWDEWVETIPHIFIAPVGGEAITGGKDILEVSLTKLLRSPSAEQRNSHGAPTVRP